MGLGFLGFLGPLIRLLFLAGVVVAVVLSIRYGARFRRNGGREDSSLEILRRRYANGEISKEEFEEKKKDLS